MKLKSLFTLFLILLCACTVAQAPTSTPAPPTETPAPPTTSTPTIVWFPPTATPTLFPTPVITPTQDMHPQIGAVLLQDEFTDEQAWTLTHTEAGSIAYGKNELTIAIGETNAYLYSIRAEPIFSDFYMEITADTNLCRDLDEYGILLRVSPNIDYYRFSLSCNGQVRLDRIYRGQASSPQPWILSGSVAPGAPATSRLAVSAIGSEMRFFVNDRYQFTVRDPLLVSGGLGVFARSTSHMAMTVNFSKLIVYAVKP